MGGQVIRVTSSPEALNFFSLYSQTYGDFYICMLPEGAASSRVGGNGCDGVWREESNKMVKRKLWVEDGG